MAGCNDAAMQDYHDCSSAVIIETKIVTLFLQEIYIYNIKPSKEKENFELCHSSSKWTIC